MSSIVQDQSKKRKAKEQLSADESVQSKTSSSEQSTTSIPGDVWSSVKQESDEAEYHISLSNESTSVQRGSISAESFDHKQDTKVARQSKVRRVESVEPGMKDKPAREYDELRRMTWKTLREPAMDWERLSAFDNQMRAHVRKRVPKRRKRKPNTDGVELRVFGTDVENGDESEEQSDTVTGPRLRALDHRKQRHSDFSQSARQESRLEANAADTITANTSPSEPTRLFHDDFPFLNNPSNSRLSEHPDEPQRASRVPRVDLATVMNELYKYNCAWDHTPPRKRFIVFPAGLDPFLWTLTPSLDELDDACSQVQEFYIRGVGYELTEPLNTKASVKRAVDAMKPSQLQMLLDQMHKEALRWHPDNLAMRNARRDRVNSFLATHPLSREIYLLVLRLQGHGEMALQAQGYCYSPPQVQSMAHGQ